VRLGSCSADLVAIETEGRLCIVEVKLAKNAEARRAVVAQVLTYAAYLRGTSRQAFETDVIGSHIQERFDSLAAAVSADDITGSFDSEAFLAGVEESLGTGSFRLVLVLDAAPPELVKLVGYLELVAPQLVFDLITVSPYDVAGTRILVPQRVEPEREADVAHPGPKAGVAKGTFTMDAGVSFRERLSELPAERRDAARRLYEWGAALEADGFARLGSFHGKQFTLLPYLVDEDVGLTTVWPDGNLALWRSVFLRRAPNALPLVEQLLDKPMGQPAFVKNPSDALLEAVRAAYAEAKH